tara:strand:- start:183 stop:923 length:741 start_codon:yes stop_codon:yes gene_type:complete
VKNVVFIDNIVGNKLPYSKYSIHSWKKWCDNNDCDLVILDELLCDESQIKVTWQKYNVLDILKNSNIEYNQVLMINTNTIIHPDTPNFFDMTKNKYSGVHQEGSMDWICRSIEHFSKFVFDDKTIPYERYINSEFQIFNKTHQNFHTEFLNFYSQNKERINWVQEKFGVGSDQTPLNLFLSIKNIDFEFLPYEFNMTAMHQKEILDDKLTFTKLGWIYKFDGLPNTDLINYFIKKTHKHLYGELVG